MNARASTFELPATPDEAGKDLFDYLDCLGPAARYQVEGIAEPVDLSRLLMLDDRLRDTGLSVTVQVCALPPPGWRKTMPAVGYYGALDG